MDHWKQFDYHAFLNTYTEALPPRDARLRRAAAEHERLGCAVPVRQLAELAVMALWREYDDKAPNPPLAWEPQRPAKKKPHSTSNARARPTRRERLALRSEQLIDAVRRSTPTFGERAKRLQLQEATLSCLARDVARWDSALAKRREALNDAVTFAQRVRRGMVVRRQFMAARGIARAVGVAVARRHLTKRRARRRAAATKITRFAKHIVLPIVLSRRNQAARKITIVMKVFVARTTFGRAVRKLACVSRAFAKQLLAMEVQRVTSETLEKTAYVVAVQRRVRGATCRKRHPLAKKAATAIRSLRRSGRLTAVRHATTTQRRVRGKLARRCFVELRRAAVVAQSLARARQSSRRLVARRVIANRLGCILRDALRTRRLELAEIELQATAASEAEAAHLETLFNAPLGTGGSWSLVDVEVGQLPSESGCWGRDAGIVLSKGGTLLDVALSSDGSYALDAMGRCWHWTPLNAPSLILARPRFVSISAGDDHVAAIDTNARVWTWGSNVHGELGLGYDASIGSRNVSAVTSPTLLPRLFAAWVGCGAHFSFARCLNHENCFYSWGAKESGVLGLGLVLDDIAEPTRVAALEDRDITTVAVGHNHCLGLDRLGALWGWGSNRFSQLVAGGPSRVLLPIPLFKCSRFDAISCGGRHSVAIARDHGTLRAWGRNDSGQLGGDGSQYVVACAAGWRTTVAVTTEGSLRFWGKKFAVSPVAEDFKANEVKCVFSRGLSLTLATVLATSRPDRDDCDPRRALDSLSEARSDRNFVVEWDRQLDDTYSPSTSGHLARSVSYPEPVSSSEIASVASAISKVLRDRRDHHSRSPRTTTSPPPPPPPPQRNATSPALQFFYDALASQSARR